MSRGMRFIVSFIIIGSLFLGLFGVAPVTTPVYATQSPDRADFSVEVGPGAEAGGMLQVVAPQAVQVDEIATFTVTGENVGGVAGFQLAVQYDDLALDFYQAEVSDELKSISGGFITAGPVHRDGMVYFSGVSCMVSDCASSDYSQAKTQTPGASGSIVIARLHFIVRAPGTHAFTLTEAKLVQADGAPAAREGTTAQAVQVVDMESLDLTENGVINDSDADALLGAWADLTRSGSCITPALAHYDVDGSGCIDVGDAQMILAHWGESARPELENAPEDVEDVDAPLTITVNSDGDAPDANPGNGICATAGGVCTLRAAVQESNESVGVDTINFNIRGPGGVCPPLVTIAPATSIIIDDPEQDGVTINGYSQCGASANSAPVAGNAVVKIQLVGNMTLGIYGLYVNSPNNTIRGLSIYNFNYQILLRGLRSHHNLIAGNFIGTNAAQTHLTTFTGENDGIRIDQRAHHNNIGSTALSDRNLISGNDQDGLNMQSPEVSYNVALNNYIGLKQNGVERLRNSSDGVDIAGGAHHNTIGGLGVRQRNVISGNHGDGVEISHDNVHNNDVIGNFIGLNAFGNGITRNDKKGVTFEDVVTNNRVFRNIIVGNGGPGVRLYTSDDNEVYDNFIGSYPSGIGPNVVVPVPVDIPFTSLVDAGNGTDPDLNEGRHGVYLLGGSSSNLVQRNVISNHPTHGVLVSSEHGYLTDVGSCQTYFNRITENRIFNNGGQGIRLLSSTCNNVAFRGNQGQEFPVITSATPGQVRGTTCAGCVVEVFIADKTAVNNPTGDNFGEGKRFIGKATANGGGQFTVNVSGASAGDIVTATATSPTGNTSQFARNFLIGSADPDPESGSVYLPLAFKR